MIEVYHIPTHGQPGRLVLICPNVDTADALIAPHIEPNDESALNNAWEDKGYGWTRAGMKGDWE